jgi:GAF domain-containing protein
VVPISQQGETLGSIVVGHADIGAFSDAHVALLQTFADQAVIAIENVRLFTELQEKNRALTQAHAQVTETLEQQTATSEILRVIASSPTDDRPVFETIVGSALRLLDGHSAGLRTLHENELHISAFTSTTSSGDSALAQGPIAIIPVSSSPHSMRVVNERTPSVVEDTEIGSDLPPEARLVARARGYRSVLTVPLLRGETVLGVINVTRRAPGPFSTDDIALLQTFADQAAIAIGNVRLFKELEEKNRDLTQAHAQVTEALEQQMATADILRTISTSPSDVRPVLEAVVQAAARFCDAPNVMLARPDGDILRLVAGVGAFVEEAVRRAGGMEQVVVPIDRGSVFGRSALERRTVHVADLAAEPEDEYPTGRALQNRFGHRTMMSTPLLRDGVLVGVIGLFRYEVRPFSTKQIGRLAAFADQAVIAIENVRLFTELQEKNRALTQAHAQVTEALEQQTATSEILRVISSSPTDVQPVFNAIVESATRLCGARVGHLFRFDGEFLYLVAGTSTPAYDDLVQRLYPMRPSQGQVSGRAILSRTVAQIPDVLTDLDYRHDLAVAGDWRSRLGVPLLREGSPIGVIVIMRADPGLFADYHVELLKTFADQAVIAIENVRPFNELQTSNRELTTALDTQTATSDILRVISRSQTDVQPVFDAIVASAVRLLRAYASALTRVVDDQIELAAFTRTDDAGAAVLRAGFPQSLQSDLPHAQTIRNRAPLNIADDQTDPRLPEAERARARARGFRSRVLVPLLRHDEAIGAISVARSEPGDFNVDEIALLETFADQAVIAIENARLLAELQARTEELTRSVEQLTALGEVGRAVSSTLDLETVLSTIVSRAVQLSGVDGGVLFEYDESTEEFSQRAMTETGGALAEARRATRIRKGEGVLGRTAITLEPVQVADIALPGAYEGRLREILIDAGIRAILAVPMVREGHLIGCLGVTRNHPGEFPAETTELLRTFATQSALALQNARLFLEIEDKSRQLELASQHKSEFLANMSHELRTPLNAIIGFSEVLSERMFGELNEKQEEYLKDIYASGTHLLSLINDILDLSKIEAGRMELELTDFDLPTAIDNALMLVRERAGRRSIALHTNIDNRLGQIQADERKVRQVVLNLLSNAIKFTPEGGRIEVQAGPKDGFVEVSVSDTGVGIASEDQEAVFEEFRQVGTADKKVEGTGLGLTLCRKFVELHGGRIRVKSELGVGSTFTFTLPLRSA